MKGGGGRSSCEKGAKRGGRPFLKYGTSVVYFLNIFGARPLWNLTDGFKKKVNDKNVNRVKEDETFGLTRG